VAKQRGLGKGLSVLIPTSPTKLEEESFEERVEKAPLTAVSCSELFPNPFQPRRGIENDQLENLAASIKEHGIIQPILVRKSDNGYQIIAGERRWRAALLSGLTEVPVRELDISDAQAMEFALVENLQREDLTSMEIAQGIQDLISRLSLTHEEAARKIGLSRAAVTNKLRLLQLPPDVIAMLESGEMTEGHARALLALPSADKIVEYATLAVENDLNVRQLEEMVRNMPVAAKIDAAFPRKTPPSPEFEEEIALLQTNYKLNIRVAGSKKNMGLVIKGLKKWQVQLLLEYLEQHSEELFPRE
jgi:ParB family chromosome partitioning protein